MTMARSSERGLGRWKLDPEKPLGWELTWGGKGEGRERHPVAAAG